MKLFQKTKKKTGLALGGGAVLGAVHVGVLKALEEKNIKVDCLSGTSIGSFVGALYAFGVDVDEIEKLTRDLRWLDISEISLSKFGLMSNEKFGELLVEKIGDKNIEDAKIPMRIIATDIATGEKVILEKGNLADAVRASACLPGIFKPVEIDGRLLVDGGIVENVPVTPLVDMGADYIIAVQLTVSAAAKRPEHIIEVMLNTFEFMITNISKPYLKDVNVLIKPDLSDFDKVDTDQISDLIKKGYEEAQKMLEN
ncbi:MAG: patatin [Balneolaceae bacterium]|nr:MAG: patatin [Balneolaceae bacterium]